MARPNLYDLTSENFGQEQADIIGPPYVDTVTQFATNDSTPSVAAGNVFITANSSATTITGFDDGSDGQEIEVKVDANTTIEHNDNIKLFGGDNFTGVGTSFISDDNAIIKLRRFSGVWVQVAPVCITSGTPPSGPGVASPDVSPGVSEPASPFGSPTTPPPVSSPSVGGSPFSTSLALGVWLYGARPPQTDEQQFVDWAGRTPDLNMDSSWSGSSTAWTFATSPNTLNGSFDEWGQWLATHPTRRMDLVLGMCPWSGTSGLNAGALLAEVAAGTHDSKFATWANQMAGFGLKGDADRPIYIRLGHEMSGDWFPWGVYGSDAVASAYANYPIAWRKIVDALNNAQPTNNWKFVFCPNDDAYRPGTRGIDWLEGLYPGDSYVDLIGMDIYDRWTGYYPPQNSTTWLNAWNNFHRVNLTEMNTWAIAHGKRQCIGECGVVQNILDGGLERGGLDNASFIQNVYNWVTTHDFEYFNYFDVSSSGGLRHSLSNQSIYPFPNAAATFLSTFATLAHPW